MEDKLRILKMIEAGTIIAEQGAEQTGLVKSSYDKKMFRVIVDSTTGDKVNIQFPISAIKKILKATGKLPIPEEHLKGVDLSSMLEAVSECLDGELEGDFVNVEAGDGTFVSVKL